LPVGLKIVRAGVENVDAVALLFDRYRQFYGQASDLLGATAFLTQRLTNQQSVVFLAIDEGSSSASGLGFVQLYPSFSSVRMRPIWILNDLFVAQEVRRGGVARLLMDAALDLARSTTWPGPPGLLALYWPRRRTTFRRNPCTWHWATA
jgi:GNAT superfamily N-acetyltransferase